MMLRRACLSVLVAGAITATACQKNDPAPGGPSGTSSPTPAPTPTPTPEPTPTPVGTCTLAPRPDCGPSGCCKEGGTPLFDAEIRQAQNAVFESRPDWFKPNGSLRVSDVQYTQAVADKLTELFSLCAIGGDTRNPPGGHSISSDEVGVKRDNGTSQNVDIVLGSSNRPSIVEHFTCRPASF